jgi:quinone-modifying oxidoreductase subunit QmoC
MAYRQFAFPSFMGRALASAKALPLLILTPVVILIACIMLTAPRNAGGGFLFMQNGVIDFNLFLPHSSVDALFVFGNILIFTLAAVGFTRFWKMLQSNGDRRQLSFARAALLTLKEIFSHSKFRQCGINHPRAIAHMLLFFGFIGAMITTGAVLLFIFVPHYLALLGLERLHALFALPLELPHPIKILGVISGLALLLGSGIMVYRRWAYKDDVGADGYADKLFLYVIFFAGLTGLTSYVTRLTGVASLAYANYFAHIVCVYFLLWYMPFSKFAHMFYRTLARSSDSVSEMNCRIDLIDSRGCP